MKIRRNCHYRNCRVHKSENSPCRKTKEPPSSRRGYTFGQRRVCRSVFRGQVSVFRRVYLFLCSGEADTATDLERSTRLMPKRASSVFCFSPHLFFAVIYRELPCILTRCTVCHRAYHRVLPRFTAFYRVLPRFTPCNHVTHSKLPPLLIAKNAVATSKENERKGDIYLKGIFTRRMYTITTGKTDTPPVKRRKPSA